MRAPLSAICFALLLSCACRAKPNGSKSKKPKQVVPAIECDVRAGKINLPEFIVKCPAHCKETKQQVYGTGVFASISSICNAAIHSGVITNTGGKVIVKKMAGQNIYKGSNSNGVRSLSLPKWRESFAVYVGKPKKGVIYPSTLDYVPSRPTYVKPSQKEAKSQIVSTPPPPTTPEPTTTTTPEPTTTQTTTEAPTTTTAPPTTTTTKARAAVHKVRDAGSSHPYLASVAAASTRQSQSGAGKSPLQVFRGGAYPSRFPQRISAGLRRQETSATIRRQPSAPVGPALNRVQPPASDRSQATVQSNSNPTFPRRDWAPPSYPRPDWFPGARRPADVSYAVPDSGYSWTETSDTADVPARDQRPDFSDFERWYYNFGPYLSRSFDADGNRKVSLDSTHTRVEPVDAWKPDINIYESGFNLREPEPIPRIPEPVSQGDPNCKVDLVFLMDGSWSIGKRRFKIQKDFLSEVAQTINVGVAGPMMGVIQYGDDPVTEISLKSYSSSRDVKSAVEKIAQKGGQSNVGKALSYINKLYFSDANGNRGGAPNVAVVLVDGWPTDKVEEASRLARESGINIFFVTIEGPDENEKHNLVEANFVDKAVCRTNGFFSLPVSSWFGLRKAVQPLVKRVCDTDRLVCSKTCLNANDIAFVIDGSSSVGTGNFRTVLQFVANVTREFEISDTDTRVGAVQYTYEQRLEFAFGQYNNKVELLNAIKRINYWSGGTSTGAAITYAAEQLFSKSKPNKRKIMIVITDGRSYDDVRAPSLAVHRQGVIAYSIGIAWAAQDELEYIATDPDKEHSFFVDEFDNLYKYVPKIIQNICQEFNSQPRN
ncbi:vitrin isoform X1 [Periophthalmus magnuspinnatus]|uniref:vitrin isoform X1 n=1 Tax=Periophthalmus magnuspinnatus TaxID=409849 RepID=UPI00145B43D5|nr:vitrin isoform X1 [Periophthalmus magnuspinnatus]